MARHEQLSVGELEVENIVGGSDCFRKEIYLDPTSGSDGNDGLSLARAVKTWAFAKAKITSQVVSANSAIKLVPGSSGLSLAADPAWTLNCGALIGLAPEAMMNQRSRIGMSGAYTPMITISGYGNLFKNLYLQHGTAAGDLVGAHITGSRNAFHNVHFAGPMAAAQASEAGFIGVHIDTVAETYFKKCFFGNNTQDQDEASSLVKMSVGCGIAIFEECIFMMRAKAADTDPYFVTIDNTTDTGLAIFKKCLFIAAPNGGTPAVAINFVGAAVGYAILDAECQFCNVTNIAATDKDQFVRMGTILSSTDDDVGMIMTTPALA
jgi:hypothetical protein